MRVIAKGSFDRDLDKIRGAELKLALTEKINQLVKAKSLLNVTGLKILRGYKNHCRIIVETSQLTYRIGAICTRQYHSGWSAFYLAEQYIKDFRSDFQAFSYENFSNLVTGSRHGVSACLPDRQGCVEGLTEPFNFLATLFKTLEPISVSHL